MNKNNIIILTCLSLSSIPAITSASPESDLNAFRDFFNKRFPDVKNENYKDGIYALDKDRRDAWLESEEFAPAYEDAIEHGKKLFNTPFANGKTYASCFKNGGIGIKQNYPYFDKDSGQVMTLEKHINLCRSQNGESPLKYKTGKIATISAYMSYTSRGKTIKIDIPNDPRAIAIYNKGKKHFYSKRGQLNFSCADCHVQGSGNFVRSEILSPAWGQVTHFPVWRKKWAASSADQSNITAGLGTLHRRYSGCNNNIRAKPFKAQSEEYVALEYFHTYMNNGQQLNGPALRQ